MTARRIVVLDVETTGLSSAWGDEIIELAAERLEQQTVVERFHAYVRPTVAISPGATAVHGLTDGFIARYGREDADVFPRFAEFSRGSTLVGHNIRRFDYPFLCSHFERCGIAVPRYDLIDTLELARRSLRLPSYRLGVVAAHFGIGTDGAHRARRDVEITRQVFLALQLGAPR